MTLYLWYGGVRILSLEFASLNHEPIQLSGNLEFEEQH